MLNVLNMLSDIATAVGVVFAGSQLWISRKDARTTFEDQLTTQYREIIRKLPIGALLGDELPESEVLAALPDFFHYFDLCNEQKYLRDQNRIEEATWNEWQEGILQNLRRPAFARAWQIVAPRVPDSFDQLRLVSPPRPVVS